MSVCSLLIALVYSLFCCDLLLSFAFWWPDIQTNECLTNNGGCWQDMSANITACRVSRFFEVHFNLLVAYLFFLYLIKNKLQDTFRGRVCECPVVQGVKFSGDGYTHCQGNLLLFFVKITSEFQIN